MKEINTDILIVESGLVGLVAAHCLSALEYNVTLVDKRKFTNSGEGLKDSRTVAISEGSKEFLDKLVLWKELKQHVQPIKKIKVFDRRLLNKIFCNIYNKLSYKNAYQLFQITDKLNSHFKETNFLYKFFSNSGFKIIDKTPTLKNSITKFAMGF